MVPVRASFGAGVLVTVGLTVVLPLASTVSTEAALVAFVTATGPCAGNGPPYCGLESRVGAVVIAGWYTLLFVVVWPLAYVAFERLLAVGSGLSRGTLFGLVLWSGYVLAVRLCALRRSAFPSLCFISRLCTARLRLCGPDRRGPGGTACDGGRSDTVSSREL